VALFLVAGALLAFQEEREIAAWIDDLGHEEIARREEASSRLLKAGVKALPALLKARESKDPEKALRVRDLIAEIERPEKEKLHDAAMRPQALGLVSLDFKDGRLSDVLAALEKQLKIRFLSMLPLETRVSITVKDVPYRKCLDDLEDRLDASIFEKDDPDIGRVWQVSRGRFLRKPRAYLPGATVDFSKKSFEIDGNLKGWRLKVQIDGRIELRIESWEAKGSDGSPRTVETCDVCSPRLVFIRSDRSEEFRVRFRGKIVWASPYELEVSNPTVGQSFRVGPYTATYDFPSVRITSSEAIPAYLFASAWLEGQLKDTDRSDRLRWEGGLFAGGGGGGGWGGRGATWCRCVGGPSRVANSDGQRIQSKDCHDSACERNQPADFASMKVVFRKRFEEPFEADVVIPAD